MKLPFRHLNVFTHETFGGNPAVVVVLDNWPSVSTMQSIAAENNVPTTAFVVPQEGSSALRWFTPTVELGLCGHGTVATGAVLFKDYFPRSESLRFRTQNGELVVTRDHERLYLLLPSRPGSQIKLERRLMDSLRVEPVEALSSRDLVVVLKTQSDVQSFVPDFAVIESLNRFAFVITAPGVGVDFVSRAFEPGNGIPEDAVTGSAHATLVPYWANRLKKTELSAVQLSARKGKLACELQGDLVRIGGEVVEYCSGYLYVPTNS